MIKDMQPISMAESLEYIKKGETGATGFIKKFVKLNPKDASELKDKLNKLDLMKLKEEHIAKIIDIFPENAEDLNKIFVGVSLNEDETKKILETVKEFK
ncbi:MAG: hypothetical protein QF567_01070 [Candidatus Pacearchaeota archaeon]|jgi:DNA-directed RNA polymerase subunit F|nr:hypothetical protein [Candidatus Pacearchaeota archaeon]|tara:strand:- start:10179 stop:10475 length:297 start_codon:yes stop_codon:yes gene_type:complete